MHFETNRNKENNGVIMVREVRNQLKVDEVMISCLILQFYRIKAACKRMKLPYLLLFIFMNLFSEQPNVGFEQFLSLME